MTPEEIAAGVAELVTEAVRRAVLEEREACARLAEEWTVEIPDQETFHGDGIYCTVTGLEVASLIRERAD
jgi:hypothetical protein